MITGELKNKIDAMWDVFAAGGLVNPLEVIEQVTYLMFIHDLDDADNIRAKESAMLGLPYKSIFSKKVNYFSSSAKNLFMLSINACASIP